MDNSMRSVEFFLRTKFEKSNEDWMLCGIGVVTSAGDSFCYEVVQGMWLCKTCEQAQDPTNIPASDISAVYALLVEWLKKTYLANVGRMATNGQIRLISMDKNDRVISDYLSKQPGGLQIDFSTGVDHIGTDAGILEKGIDRFFSPGLNILCPNLSLNGALALAYATRLARLNLI